MRLEVVSFQRDKSSEIERGVMVDEGNGPLIDMNGHIVPAPIWNWVSLNEAVMTVHPTGYGFDVHPRKRGGR